MAFLNNYIYCICYGRTNLTTHNDNKCWGKLKIRLEEQQFGCKRGIEIIKGDITNKELNKQANFYKRISFKVARTRYFAQQ